MATRDGRRPPGPGIAPRRTAHTASDRNRRRSHAHPRPSGKGREISSGPTRREHSPCASPLPGSSPAPFTTVHSVAAPCGDSSPRPLCEHDFVVVQNPEMIAEYQSQFCFDLYVARLPAGTFIELRSHRGGKLAPPILGGTIALTMMVLRFGHG